VVFLPAIVAELQRDAEVLLAEQAHDVLQLIPRRRREMPCCSATSWRTVLLAAGCAVPRLMFLTGTFRRTRRVETISHSAFSLNSSSAVITSLDSLVSKSIDAFEPLKS